MKSVLSISFALLLALAAGCSSTKPVSPALLREPAARAYRTNGDFADNVMVVMSADGNKVVWHPEYNTVDASMAPQPLMQGYLLDRGNVTPFATFVSYTYDEYRALGSTPDDADIRRHLIPGSRVTEIIELPIGRYALQRNPSLADSLILKKQYKVVYP